MGSGLSRFGEPQTVGEALFVILDPVDECASNPGGCAWTDAPSEKWVSELDAWPWAERAKGEWAKSGACPRCAHPMAVIVQDGTLLGAVSTETADELDPVRAECNCRHKHDGRPEGISEGCGQAGTLRPPP